MVKYGEAKDSMKTPVPEAVYESAKRVAIEDCGPYRTNDVAILMRYCFRDRARDYDFDVLDVHEIAIQVVLAACGCGVERVCVP